MATRTGAPQGQQAGRARRRGIGGAGARAGTYGTFDLNTSGVPADSFVIDVRDWNRMSIEYVADDGGTIATAILGVKRAISKGNPVEFEPKQELTPSVPQLWGIDVSAASQVVLDVTTVEGSAQTATIRWYLYKEEPHPSFGAGFDGSLTPTLQSEGDQGSLIQVTGTTTGASVTLATAVADTDGGVWDEWDIEACNTHTGRALLTIEVIDSSNAPTLSIPQDSGFFTVLQSHPLRSANTIKAFADVANVVFCRVRRRRITGGLES